MVRQFYGDVGGTDCAGQPVGGHQELELDRGGGSLGRVGIQAQSQRAAIVHGVAVTGRDDESGGQFAVADQPGKVGFCMASCRIQADDG